MRVIVAAGLTALLLWQSDPRAVWEAARGADWRFVVLACALVAIDRVLMAYRWWTLLAPVGRREDRRYDNGAADGGGERRAALQAGLPSDGARPPLGTVMLASGQRICFHELLSTISTEEALVNDA